jgi:hypothetical protein
MISKAIEAFIYLGRIFLVFVLFAVIINHFYKKWLTSKNESDPQPHLKDLEFFKAHPSQNISEGKLAEFLGLPNGEPLSSITKLRMTSIVGRVRPSNTPSCNLWYWTQSGDIKHRQLWSGTRPGDKAALNRFVAVFKPWIVGVAERFNIALEENVNNLDNTIQVFPRTNPTETADAIFPSLLEKGPVTPGFVMKRLSANSYEFAIQLGEKRNLSRVVLREGVFEVYDSFSDSLYGVFSNLISAKEPELKLSLTRKQIVHFSSESGTRGVYVSERGSQAYEIFILQDEHLRVRLADLFNAWLAKGS